MSSSVLDRVEHVTPNPAASPDLDVSSLPQSERCSKMGIELLP